MIRCIAKRDPLRREGRTDSVSMKGDYTGIWHEKPAVG